MKQTALAPPLLLALTLTGCASALSGVGGADGYACKAPEGAMCTSVSGIYANSAHGMPRPATRFKRKPPLGEPVTYGATPLTPLRPGSLAAESSAQRSTPRLLRLWIAPWEDADGDLHEEALVHVVVDTGRWLIEHVRPAARPRVDGVAPPVSLNQESAPAKAPGGAAQAPTRYPLPPANPPSGTEPDATEQ